MHCDAHPLHPSAAKDESGHVPQASTTVLVFGALTAAATLVMSAVAPEHAGHMASVGAGLTAGSVATNEFRRSLSSNGKAASVATFAKSAMDALSSKAVDWARSVGAAVRPRSEIDAALAKFTDDRGSLTLVNSGDGWRLASLRSFPRGKTEPEATIAVFERGTLRIERFKDGMLSSFLDEDGGVLPAKILYRCPTAKLAGRIFAISDPTEAARLASKGAGVVALESEHWAEGSKIPGRPDDGEVRALLSGRNPADRFDPAREF